MSANASVAALAAKLHDQPKAPLRADQIDEYQSELRRLGYVAESRDQEGTPRPWIPGDRGLARQSIQRIRKTLNEQAPRRIEEPQRRDAVARLTQEVIRDVITPALLPTSVMRRNPAGAVGKFMRGEASPAIKQAILTAKRGLRALEPENPDPDYANMEQYRPEGTDPNGVATFMPGAQIPGNFAMTPLAKANWPLGEPTVETPLAQAKAAETTEIAPAKAPQSAGRLEALARGRATRKAKLAEAKAEAAVLAEMA